MANHPVSLVTGSGQRIGAAIVQALHKRGDNVLVHVRHSVHAGQQLVDSCNASRADSAALLVADLQAATDCRRLIAEATSRWGRLDILVNNASCFYPTALEDIEEADWQALIGSNLQAPLWLSQAALPWLRRQRGAIVNIADLYGRQPRAGYALYCVAKAGLLMLTEVLARDLGPDIRVNAVSPGAILWPSEDAAPQQDVSLARQRLVERIPLRRIGRVEEVAEAVLWLSSADGYIHGHVLAVDGGLSLLGSDAL